MFNHHYEMIVIQKQNEIEQYANEAWKFDVLKKESTFQRIMQLIKSVHTSTTKSINNPGTCAVC
jgi:hypothetical protein